MSQNIMARILYEGNTGTSWVNIRSEICKPSLKLNYHLYLDEHREHSREICYLLAIKHLHNKIYYFRMRWLVVAEVKF